MNVTKLLVTTIALSLSLTALSDDYGMAKGTVRFRVIDEDGVPVPDANFLVSDMWSATGHRGVSDKNGLFSCYMRKLYPPIWAQLTKRGYYTTQGDVWSGPFGVLPDGILTVTLKRIVNPVPMVKREVRLLFPVLGEPVGFDFEKGDWVDPHGDGETSDVYITGQKLAGDPDNIDFRAWLMTSNTLNGFISFPSFPMYRMTPNDPVRSSMQPPQVAPVAGYTNTLAAYHIYKRGKPLESNVMLDQDYLFRLRSVTNNLGEVTSAHVGWFMKSVALTGFKVHERETGKLRSTKNDSEELQRSRLWITFAYYWNPDPTSRSLEPKEIADRQ